MEAQTQILQSGLKTTNMIFKFSTKVQLKKALEQLQQMIAVLTGQVQAIMMKQSGTSNVEDKTGNLPIIWSQWSTCSYQTDPQSQVCVGFRSRSKGLL